MREGLAPGLWSGVGLVAANMIGSGVFLSSGFMAQDMGPGTILLGWLVGAVLALGGAQAYAALARAVPRSGGEYRFLSELLHPALGYLAGWASLLVGFSAPIAVSALAAAAYTATLVPGVPPRPVAAGFVLVLTVLHATGLRLSTRTQNALVVVKVSLLAIFVGAGLALGRAAWPEWTPPRATDGFPVQPFALGLFFVAFAFSGWNAAAYAAEEFRRPGQDAPRAMLLGCALVSLLYLLVNWILVANLTPERATAVLGHEAGQVTLAHLVMRDVVGEAGARLVSLMMVAVFVSSISAMVFAGPRVYAAMARDGFLPRVLGGRTGQPPSGSVALQGALALFLVVAQGIRETLQAVGGILTFFAALTALCVFRLRQRHDATKPSAGSLVAAALYALTAVWMLYFGFHASGALLAWIGSPPSAQRGWSPTPSPLAAARGRVQAAEVGWVPAPCGHRLSTGKLPGHRRPEVPWFVDGVGAGGGNLGV